MNFTHWLTPLLADAGDAATPSPGTSFHLPEGFWPNFLATLLFSLLALALSLLAFKLFDWITPRIDIQHELGEKHNLAVAIVCAAIILGSCYLVAIVVRGSG